MSVQSAPWARMWEARVESGRLDEASTWLRQRALPAALAAGATSAEGFRAGGASERVVLISRWTDRAAAQSYAELAPPAGLMARADAWVFEVLRAPEPAAGLPGRDSDTG